MSIFLSWLFSRIAEPSTWAGLAIAGQSVANMINTGNTSSDSIGMALNGLGVAFGVIAAGVREKGGGN